MELFIRRFALSQFKISETSIYRSELEETQLISMNTGQERISLMT